MNSSNQEHETNIDRLVDANNRLAVDLLDYIRKDDQGNVFFSPDNILQTVAMAGLALEEEEIIYFHVDRSFVFMIVDRRSGAVLFMGSVVKPEKWEEKEERLLC